MKKDLSSYLTVFVVSSGDNPNYEDCLSALKNQSVKFNIDIIKDYRPMSAAFQEMLNRCKTPYYIECDEDMILYPEAIAKMYDGIFNADEKCAMLAYKLMDVHLTFEIFGVKIYKYNVFKNYPYNLECLSCEVEQLDRIKADGYKYSCIEDVVGDHSPKWEDHMIFERYYNLMEKFKEFGYIWLEDLPKKLWGILQQNPTEQNLHALLGAYTSIIKSGIDKEEKDYTKMKRQEFSIMDSFLYKPISATVYMTSQCNYKCEWCYRQHNDVEKAPDMDIHTINEMLHKFPTIKAVCVCFTGDTKVKLVDGTHKTLKELSEIWDKHKEKFEVYSRDDHGNIVPGLAYAPRKTRSVNKLVQITLDNGEIIKSTEDHYYMIKNYNVDDKRVRIFNGMPYIQAKDLTNEDSLMPLYTSFYDNHEYISDDSFHGMTHRLFAKYHFKSIFDKVVHHSDLNPSNNTKTNLSLLDESEHIRLHANLPHRRRKFAKARDEWNKSEAGRQHLLEHNDSLELRKKNSDRLKIWKKTDDGKKQTYKNLEYINGNREIVLKNNKNPFNILKRRQGMALKILKEVVNSNLPVTEENYNRFWRNGYPKFNKINDYFGNLEDAISAITYNHKIIKKETILCEDPIDMYCLSVEKYGNFALSSGVFVKNCGFGEPFMSPNLKYVIQTLKNKGVYVGLITNGSYLEDKLDELINYPNAKPEYISISLNAITAEAHKQVNKTQTFDKVLRGIKLCVERGVQTFVSYVCTHKNLNEIPELIKLAKSLGVETVHLHNLLPHFKEEQNDGFWDLVLQKEDEQLIENIKKLPGAEIIKGYPTLIDKNETQRKCRFPWRTIAVDGAGNISVCNSVYPCDSKNGNIRDHVLWQNEYCRNFRQSLLTEQYPACRKCFRNWKWQ